MLRCPADHHSLKVQTVGRATFAHCVYCAGIWLTREALLPPSLDPAALPPATRVATPATRKRKTPLQCPECGGPLTPERVEGIEIDRCTHCVGVWLDAGEYDAVRRYIEILILACPVTRIPRPPLTPRLGVSSDLGLSLFWRWESFSSSNSR